MAYAPTLAWVPLSGPEEAQLVAAHAERMQRYADFLAIPSVSAIPEYAPDCRKAAEWLAAELRRMWHRQSGSPGWRPTWFDLVKVS